MLLHAAPAWLPRLTAALSIFLGLLTLHYFYFPSLPHLDSIVPTSPTSLANGTKSADVLSPVTIEPEFAPADRWTIKWIPEKHWQIWRINIADFEPTELERMRTWRWQNPFHRYEVFSHDSAETFVRSTFTKKLEIANTFLALKDMIIRADFLRYLILYGEGGVYSDIDTKALKPITNWIPDQYKNRVNVVIGLEIDEPNVMWGDWADNFVFCQSTMMASPGHRIYEILINSIIHKLDTMSHEKNTDLASLDLSFQDVLRITGPVAFTDAVMKYFTEVMGETITRANFTGINVPKKMADVLVMPTVAFVPGQPHSRSRTPEDKDALVQHMGMGSWRSTHLFENEKEEKEQKQKEEEEKKKQEEEEQKKLEEANQKQEEENKHVDEEAKKTDEEDLNSDEEDKKAEEEVKKTEEEDKKTEEADKETEEEDKKTEEEDKKSQDEDEKSKEVKKEEDKKLESDTTKNATVAQAPGDQPKQGQNVPPGAKLPVDLKKTGTPPPAVNPKKVEDANAAPKKPITGDSGDASGEEDLIFVFDDAEDKDKDKSKDKAASR